MAEELDLPGQDSDGDSEDVVLTPAELIERLEQVSTPSRIPLLPSGPFYLVQLCACQELGNEEMELKAYFKRRGTPDLTIYTEIKNRGASLC